LAAAKANIEWCEQFDLCAFVAICCVNRKEVSILINFLARILPYSLPISTLFYFFLLPFPSLLGHRRFLFVTAPIRWQKIAAIFHI